MKNNKGFVVSAILYPLLVLFLALIMGLLAMTDTRKRILDKMKLEISDSIFDEATCSCDTILNKLNYLIKNGVGGGGGGSYSQNVLGLNVTTYESPVDIPNVGNNVGDIAIVTETEMPDNNYYVSTTPPGSPKEGTIWIVQDRTSNYYIESDYSKIGISYVMQYENDTWNLKKSYVYQNGKWELLYYVNVHDHEVDLTGTDISVQIETKFKYTGDYQVFTAKLPGYYRVELWGAQGGSYYAYGGYTSGSIYLESGATLYVYVGRKGTTGTSYSFNGGAPSANGNGNSGGGGGNNGNYGGSGGSSYISGHAGCIAVTSEGFPKAETYTTLTHSIHYTNMKFTNTTMVDGYGYQWTTVKGNTVFYMPSYDEKSTMTGNSGNGYAKITYLGQ